MYVYKQDTVEKGRKRQRSRYSVERLRSKEAVELTQQTVEVELQKSKGREGCKTALGN